MLGRSCYIAVCIAWPVVRCMNERSPMSLTACRCWCSMGGHRSRIIGVTWVRCRQNDLLWCIVELGQYLLVVRTWLSPTPSSIISAKASDLVTTMMHERVLVHFPFAETYNKGRFIKKLLLCKIIQSLLYPRWEINVNTAVLVHGKSKRIVPTFDTLEFTH